jgi:hypothetical protein
MKCYEILTKSAKWHKYNLALEKKNNPKKPSNNQQSSPPSSSVPSSAPVTAKETSEASDNKTERGPPACPIGRKKAKIAYQEDKLDISNHKQLTLKSLMLQRSNNPPSIPKTPTYNGLLTKR